MISRAALPTLAAVLFAIGALAPVAAGAESAPLLPPIEVASDGHSFEAGGRPFFWLGDTAWELIHSTTPEESSYYLATRARQGFTVIQTVVLAENDGLHRPTPQGLTPFRDDDPAKPNEAYFDRVATLVDEAAHRGLYVGLLPAWGDKVTSPWGTGPRIFTLDDLPAARAYGRYLANKLRGRTNVIWILGGDRPPMIDGQSPDWMREYARDAGVPAVDWRPIWREMAAGIAQGSARAPFFAYHPPGGSEGTSARLHQEPWLGMNAVQSGHGGGHDVPVWEWIARDFALRPPKPVIDMEPNYEDHPVNPWPEWDAALGYFRDYDVRKQLYRSVFAGGAGVTYGHHAVWPFVGERNPPINHTDRGWREALTRPGAAAAQHLRYLLESRPFAGRAPDPALIVRNADTRACHAEAARGRAADYAFIYFPCAEQALDIDLARLEAPEFDVWWYDPRNGIAQRRPTIRDRRVTRFQSPMNGPDWVLVLDAAARAFAPPGLTKN